jgi:hypothetical protein
MPYQRPRNPWRAPAGLYYPLVTAARANPVVMAWRWRWELGLAGVLTAAGAALGLPVALALVANVAGLLGGLAWLFPALRRFLAARFWCVVTPHRVRAGCVHGWIHSRYGKIPVILLTTAQPYGERVYLWCRAGTSASDFADARDLLATACWADDVLVSRDERYAHLVCLDVIRRSAAGSLMASGPQWPVHSGGEFGAGVEDGAEEVLAVGTLAVQQVGKDAVLVVPHQAGDDLGHRGPQRRAVWRAVVSQVDRADPGQERGGVLAGQAHERQPVRDVDDRDELGGGQAGGDGFEPGPLGRAVA